MCLFCIAAQTALADSILIPQPIATPATAQLERYLDDQLLRAAALASESLELPVGYQGFSVSREVARPEYTASIMAVDVPGSRSMMVNLTGPAGTKQHFVMGDWTSNTYRDIASTLEYVYLQLTGNTERGDAQAARYLLDWNTSYLATDDLDFSLSVYPYGISTTPAGTLLVSGNSLVVELDRYFREVQKIGVGAIDGYSWAQQIESTPAGSIYVAGAAGQDVYRLLPSLPRPQRMRGTAMISSIAALDDATLFTADTDQRFYRFDGNSRSEVDLKLGSMGWIGIIEEGPDLTLWAWDASAIRFSLFDHEGVKIDSMMPQIDAAEAGGIKDFVVYPDSSILALSHQGLVKIDPDGFIEWRLDNSTEPELGGLTTVLSVDFDPAHGLIYLVDASLRRLIQLVDIDWVRQTRELTAAERRLLEASDALREYPDDSEALASRAQILEEQDAWEAAAHVWDLAASVDPFSREAETGLERAQVRLLKRRAAQAYERTIEALESFGVATAAEPYNAARRLFEELLARAPEDDEARRDLQRLDEAYNARSVNEQQRKPITVTEVSLPNLFPALMQVYNAQTVGTIRVENTLDEPVTNLTTEVAVRFTDFPRRSEPIDRLEPGESAELGLYVPFSPDVLALQEDIPVQAGITLRYQVGGSEQETTETATVLIHRNTALVWDDSAKLASFVMPNEEVVRVFSLSVADPGPRVERYSVSQRIFRAARIADAVGLYEIDYIEDPDSPFSEILGSDDHVDTVRFPRDTLRTRTGDCDDTTALLCSLYEAAGIPTAIMTSPGHVFLAFDTGEPIQNAWLFESASYATIGHAGTVWLPVESTILEEGFSAAWAEGSRLVNAYADSGQTEFIPLRQARAQYPALALDRASFEVLSPDDERIDRFFEETTDSVVSVLYGSSVTELESRIASSRGRSLLRLYNQLGILHARFGEPDRARQQFRAAIDEDDEYAASYVNLANIEILEQRPRQAIDLLDRPELARSNATLVNLLLAQAHSMLGDREQAGEHLAIVRARAPELAEQYASLATTSSARAGEANEQPLLPWAVGDE